MKEFDVIRSYFKRKYTHKFIDFKIYNISKDFYIYKHIEDTNYESFKKSMGQLLTNFCTYDLSYGLGLKHTLLDIVLLGELSNIKLNLDTEKYKQPLYITSKETKKYTKEQLKNKIMGMIAGEYIIADAYRFIIKFIINNKTKELYTKEIEALLKLRIKHLKDKYYTEFLDILISLLKPIILLNYNDMYFYDSFDKNKKEEIINNTQDNISKLDEEVILDQTLLLDLGMSTNNFIDAFDSDYIQNIILKQVFVNIPALIDFKSFSSDTVISDFKFKKNEIYNISIVESFKDLKQNNLSLYNLTKALIESLSILTIIRTISLQKSEKKKRILDKIDAYTKNAKYSYLNHLHLIRYFIDHKAENKYIFVVYLSHYLGLSKSQAVELSTLFHMNNKGKVYKKFEEIQNIIFPNYKFLK
ncbi:MAG: hypothetical protein KAQ94_06585 [Arcobacteraceae bacterium]|nr:hypothetical protein [Arcobacteraceae bacterium]